ncbi:hemerythrin domain-containing protein [Streptomyces sp. NPDC048664]|uniref:hemerythrin domain-containing protein n=1 Tax=Streptomyces sp. NPDC048664 TaxID=3154505 RepID=UPI00343055A4
MSPSNTTGGLPAAERPYTHEMVVVHRIFRRESALLPRMVRAVPEGDTARAAKVAAFVRDYVDGLHLHHAAEDDLLWPPLRDRVTDTALVARMREQHERIDRSLESVAVWTPTWERAADPVAGQELALALEEHRAALLEHLDDEERLLLPLAAEHLSVAEWDAVGERGLEELPKNKRLLALGAILEEATPQEAAYFLGRAPWLGRVLWKAVGRRQYAAHCRDMRTPVDGE